MIDVDYWDDLLEEEDTEVECDFEITTLIICGCGHHAIDGREDPYKEHNRWVESTDANHIENTFSVVRNIKGIGASVPKPSHSYDFSGDDFEVSTEDLRKIKK
jgi:hypothetical protein